METVRNFWNCEIEPSFALFHQPGTEITLELNGCEIFTSPQNRHNICKNFTHCLLEFGSVLAYISLVYDTEALDIILFHIYETQRVMVPK